MVCMGGSSRPAIVVLLAALTRPAASLAPGIRSVPRTTTPTWLREADVTYRKAMSQYRRASEAHYLPMAAAQSGLLRGGADALGQMLTHPAHFDPGQTAAIATIGLLVSGLGGAVWLRHLETKLGSGTSTVDVLRKTFTDYTCWAPCANSAYLFLVPLMTGHGFEYSLNTLLAGFTSIMMLEASIFMPYNLLAFNSIPAPLRPPAGSLLAACFTIGLGIIAYGSS